MIKYIVIVLSVNLTCKIRIQVLKIHAKYMNGSLTANVHLFIGGFSKQQPDSLAGCFDMIYARVHTLTQFKNVLDEF